MNIHHDINRPRTISILRASSSGRYLLRGKQPADLVGDFFHDPTEPITSDARL
jgi:hypothetical protein